MNRTLVISIDALISADIERLKKLPNLGRIMKQASWAEDILCCYPTLTYPCHVTISTGCWPDRHGICNNEKFQPLSKDGRNGTGSERISKRLLSLTMQKQPG